MALDSGINAGMTANLVIMRIAASQRDDSMNLNTAVEQSKIPPTLRLFEAQGERLPHASTAVFRMKE